MAYGDEKKVIVDVRESERAQIIYKDGEGKEHTYYPARYAYFVVENLQTLVVLNKPPQGQTEPVIARRICGTARIEGRGLSVVGDPKSKSRTLAMSFEASDCSDWRPKREPDADDMLGAESINFLGGATLSFNRHHWEIGNNDEWWSSCYLPKPFVEQLEAAIVSGQLTSVRVGLSLRGLYTDDCYGASRRNLFTRPNRNDNDIGNPDLAGGFVSLIVFTTTKVDLRQPHKPEPMDSADDFESSFLPAPVNPVSAAIAALAVRVEATRSTIKWVGAFIVVALLFVAGR